MIRYTFKESIGRLKSKEGLGTADILKRLADAGVDRATYFRLARAEGLSDFNATLQLIDRICQGLGFNPEDIFEYSGKSGQKRKRGVTDER